MLRANGFTSYIETELRNEDDLTEEQKQQLDAKCLQALWSTVSGKIATALLPICTTYKAYKHLEVFYGGKRIPELWH